MTEKELIAKLLKEQKQLKERKEKELEELRHKFGLDKHSKEYYQAKGMDVTYVR